MYICRVGINEENIYVWKQPPRGVPMKRCSENMLLIKLEFFCKFATYFQKTFSKEHLWTAVYAVAAVRRYYLKMF